MALLTLSACGGGGGGAGSDGESGSNNPETVPPTVTQSCGVESQKDFVLSVARDWYLWYDELASVSQSEFASAGEYLNALTAPLAEDFRDPGFSYLTTVAEDEANFSSGAFVGFGFRFAINDAGQYLVSDAFEGAPAAEAGFVRGAEFLAVDAGDGFVTLREFEDQGAGLDDIFGGSVAGLERSFRLRIDGSIVEVTAAKRELDVPPLATAPRILERPGLPPVAYLHLRSFTLSAEPALDEAFTAISNQGITDFIVDLRYNSGGLVNVAARFMDLLGGEIANGEIAFSISHNDKRTAENESFAFNARPPSAAPLRIAFITSETTASASELLINSLEPYVEVVLIGSDTSGKAVGQYAFDQRGCDTRLRLVSFESVNGEGFGGFYTGLVDTGRFTLCAVEDPFTGAFGTTEDALTEGALAWLNEGSCPASVGISSAGRRTLRRGSSPIGAEDRPDRRSTWLQ
ncbi:S41 family peptidase [Congregibacter litoralis]|uniref:S41 family peptidase n=1 Tax=Congregibacter litoralis TaxID=393662 RepID=UPI001930B5E3|nr:S41 family peptidase [Congregibacter litoralis]